ncbi:phage major capsid protein [Arcobacter suis]|uniref:Phage major capsid protein n=1 Tax=Arcobacter suis CECT 7833 TaxID=663365 RepID=A0AAD0SQ11_9BACT|nr:phage major capsid protein [Arcobacter suis]AXX89336.1 phage major capsid protein [Arcobacter suis CECT 7833]RWS46570.1 phage major capsid protein [Arcobacter suis]
MKTKEELIQARKDALDKMIAISTGENFAQANYDAAKKEVDSLTAQIETLDIQAKLRNQVDDVLPSASIDKDKEFERNAFWNMAKGKNLSIDEMKALSTTEGAKGGYLVPETFATTIILKSAEKSYIRNIANVSTSSHTENIPVEGDDGENGWIDEEGVYPESDPTLGQIQLAAWKTGRIVKVTDEALDDTVPAIENYIAMKFVKSTVKSEEKAFVDGDGVKKPTGFLLTAQIGKVAASSVAITSDDLLDLMGSLDPDYEQNAVLMMNKNTKNLLRKLKDSTGQYLWVPGFNGDPDTFDKKTIVINKFMPDVATGKKPIAYGDFSYYYIKDRKVMTLKRLDELYSTTGHVGFRIDKRVDGKLALPEAIKTLRMA